MAANKRTRDQILRDRAEIARLYVRGVTQAEIAAMLSGRPGRGYTLTQQMISYDLQRIREAWLALALRDYNEHIAEQLAKLDHLELTYWDAWVASLEGTTAETLTARADKDGQPRPVQSVYHKQPGRGDPRYLQGVERCIELRCRLLGLFQERVDVTSGGKPLGRSFEEALELIYGDWDEAELYRELGDEGDGSSGDEPVD